MLEDLKILAAGQTRQYDVCVIGAGPAGITIAREFDGSGITTCLLESGGFVEEADTQSLYRGESVGHPVVPDEGRYRVFGGSATRWGGRSARLDPIDFEPRPWIRHSGWPIRFETLHPYYERAAAVGNFKDAWRSDETVPAELGIMLPEITSPLLQSFVWRMAAPDIQPPPPSPKGLGYRQPFDWGKAYRTLLAKSRNVQVLLHANLVSMRGDASDSRVEEITVSSLDNITMTIRARFFVLCCGGLENARILLNAPDGLLRAMNQGDALGRFLAQHPRGCIATVETDTETAKRLQRTFTHFLRPRRFPVEYEIGFALSEQAQRRLRLLNASAALTYEGNPESPWKSARRLRDAARSRRYYKGAIADIAHVITGTGPVLANLARRFLFGRPVLLKDPIIRIVADLEQEPNPDSRVTLASTLDALGMRQPRIDWRLSEIERTTAREFAAILAEEFARLSLGTVRPSAWLTSEAPIAPDELMGNYHFIGATRMSADPRDGVVDPDCRAHGIDNLFVAGCSVFATGGHANPTLTIVALAIRVADHLRARLQADATQAGAGNLTHSGADQAAVPTGSP